MGLLLLLLATVINVGSDAVKQKRDLDASRSDARARGTETARIQAINEQVDREVAVAASTSSTLKDALVVLDHTSKTASQNAKETERLLDPIHSMYLVADFSLPLDQPLVRPYADRVQGKMVSLQFGQDGFPKATDDGEKALYRFLTRQTLDLVFTRDAGTKVLVLEAKCEPSQDGLQIQLGFQPTHLHVVCRAVARRAADDGSFRSYSDLDSAKVRFQVEDLDTHPTSGIQYAIERITLEATVDEGVRTYTSKKFLLNQIRLTHRYPNITTFNARISSLPPGIHLPN